MSYHEDRADFADAVSKLGPFIQEHTELPALKCQMLAMAILGNGQASGVVSAARALRLLKEAEENDEQT
jgi:hypothetical protein